MARKIVDPKTGARVADPSFTGMALSSGSTGSSWPEVRSQYQKGLRSAEFNRKGLDSELKSYLTGKTNKLSEDFDEPIISSGGDVRWTKTIKQAPIADFDIRKDRPTNTPMAKIPTKSANVPIPKGKLRGATEIAKPSQFESPGIQKKSSVNKNTKTITKGALNSSRPGMAEKGQAKLKGARVTTTETNVNRKSRDMMGYNRQEKQFKAYAGTSVLGESHIGKSAQDLNAYKKEYKSQRKEYRKEGNIEGAAATGMEVRQARQAEKFVKGKQTHFNDENYRKTTGKTSRIAPDYKNSADNAANRNTMEAKLNAISAKPTNRTNMY